MIRSLRPSDNCYPIIELLESSAGIELDDASTCTSNSPFRCCSPGGMCTHIYDCVCPCVVWGKGVEARVVFKIHLCRRHNTCVEAKGSRRLKYSRVVRALSECVLPLASRFLADGCVNNVLLPAGRFRIGSAVCSACEPSSPSLSIYTLV